nr:uncharacterized protein LOC109177101 [Ipomoea batatas]
MEGDVWKDPCVPRKSSPFVQTLAPEQLHGIEVVSLLNIQKDNWDMEILEDLFEESDKEHIQNTPISCSAQEGKIIWTGKITTTIRLRVVTDRHKPVNPPNSVGCEKPEHGCLKVNTDATMDSQGKSTGLDFVVRNLEGVFIAAVKKNWASDYNSKLAEAISVRETLK